MSKRDFNAEARDNDERKYSYGFDTLVRDYFLKRVGPEIRQDGASLEIGAYRGDMTEQLYQTVSHLEIVEPSSEQASHLRSRFPSTKIHECVVEEFQPDTKFDNIFLVHTLEHLENPVDTLCKVSGLLSSRGKLFVMVPNANALSRQIAVKMGLISHHAAVTEGERLHGHFRTYSLDVLLRDLSDGGLRIDSYGGVIVKPLANYQFDEAIRTGIVNKDYISACDELSLTYPDLSSSLYAVCSRRV